MTFASKLSFGFFRSLPMILQTEATECGLACLAMVAGFYGYRTDLMSLRRRFAVSLRGATLGGLISVAKQMDLNSRPLKLDLDNLCNLRLPCILHWNFNHFVVLKSVGAAKATIYDPADGIRSVNFNELSDSFTGVALELWPQESFTPQDNKSAVRLTQLMGRVRGLTATIVQVLVLALGLELLALLAPLYMQIVVDNALVAGDRNLLATLSIGFCALAVIQQCISLGRSWALLYLGTTVNLQWKANVFSHLLRLPIQYFEKRHLGDIVSRASSVDAIQRTLTTSLIEAILDGIMALLTLVMMCVYSLPLALVAIGAMVLYALLRFVWYRPLRFATEEQIVHAARQQSHFLESIRGVKAIKLFDRENERHISWGALLVDQTNSELRTQKLQLIFRFGNGLLFAAENILVVWLGAKLVLDNLFTVGFLIAFKSYKDQFDARVGALIDKFVDVRMLKIQGERLADIVFTEPETDVQCFGESDFGEIGASLTVKKLSFRYSDQDPFVLNGIDLEIREGESVAIVGPSGCGKSTLLSLLLGLMHPTEGEICVGGIPLRRLGLSRLRQLVGTVVQDDVLFAGSISDNISFFDSAPNPAWIVECAQRAAIASDIAAMPMGYNTLVGDMGTVLSGGQKQRVLLARALYKRPRILVLDEATSHLDVVNEQEVNKAIASLNMTKIIVAHRPETIASADRVIVMFGGRVVKADDISPQRKVNSTASAVVQ